jgi:fructosamine-3-kinase
MRLPKDLKPRIEQLFDSTIVEAKLVGGGCVNNSSRLRLSDGRSFFIKYRRHVPDGFYEAEAYGLEQLASAVAIRVPIVYSVSSDDSCTPHILLEYLVPGSQGVERQREFARKLVCLHSHTSNRFGLDRDNFIGQLPQCNTSSRDASWGEFFYRERLIRQALIGVERGWMSDELRLNLSKLQSVIVSKLNCHSEPPTLLHGDLWSGNVYWGAGSPCLIDPAVYFGNREADLAFLELFGDPGEEFRSEYHKLFPLADGFEERKSILNLYHLMTHANMFGGSYVRSVAGMMENILRAE